MAMTKVNRGGLNTGISDSSDATFLTVDSSEQAVIKSEGGAVTTSVQQGLVKAWCTVDENSTVTVRDGFNNSSVTDNSTANTSFTMTNAFNNTDFSLMALASQEGGATSYDLCYEISASRTSSVVRVESRNYGNGNVFDDEYKMIQICGDLA